MKTLLYEKQLNMKRYEKQLNMKSETLKKIAIASALVLVVLFLHIRIATEVAPVQPQVNTLQESIGRMALELDSMKQQQGANRSDLNKLQGLYADRGVIPNKIQPELYVSKIKEMKLTKILEAIHSLSNDENLINNNNNNNDTNNQNMVDIVYYDYNEAEIKTKPVLDKKTKAPFYPVYHKNAIFPGLSSLNRDIWKVCADITCSKDKEQCTHSPSVKRDNIANLPCCNHQLYILLLHAREILEEHNIEYKVTHGSLLGAVRQQRTIPWTHDADFEIPYNFKITEQLSKQFWELGYALFLHDIVRLCPHRGNTDPAMNIDSESQRRKTDNPKHDYWSPPYIDMYQRVVSHKGKKLPNTFFTSFTPLNGTNVKTNNAAYNTYKQRTIMPNPMFRTIPNYFRDSKSEEIEPLNMVMIDGEVFPTHPGNLGDFLAVDFGKNAWMTPIDCGGGHCLALKGETKTTEQPNKPAPIPVLNQGLRQKRYRPRKF